MKKYKILIPFLTVLAAASVVLAVMSKSYTDNRLQTITPYNFAESAYTGMLSGKGTLEFPLLQTDIDNIFYLANPNGSVVFYEVTPTGAVPYKGKAYTLKTVVSCSSQNIPVKITYIKQGDKITGYGLFTTAISKAPVKVYEYAFFKITKLPAGYGNSGVLLLVDFDKTNFNLNDKLFTEAFILNLKSGENSRLITNNARTIDNIGAYRSDWVLLYDDFLESIGTRSIFLSSRDYTLDKKGLVSEILSIGNPRPPRMVKGILGLWARGTDKGLTYLRTTNDGFKTVLFADNKETAVQNFFGDYFKDYLCSKNYILNKNSLVLTDLLIGTEKTLNGIRVNANSVLSVSPDGTWAIIASTEGSGATASQNLFLYSLSAGTVKTIAEPLIFSQTDANFCWIDNNTLFHLRPNSEDGTGLSYCILKMS